MVAQLPGRWPGFHRQYQSSAAVMVQRAAALLTSAVWRAIGGVEADLGLIEPEAVLANALPLAISALWRGSAGPAPAADPRARVGAAMRKAPSGQRTMGVCGAFTFRAEGAPRGGRSQARNYPPRDCPGDASAFG